MQNKDSILSREVMLTIVSFADSKKVRNYLPSPADTCHDPRPTKTVAWLFGIRSSTTHDPTLPVQQTKETPHADSPPTAEARQSILNQILHPEAADRLGRIRLVKEERAADVENRLIMLARSGQLQQKVTEAQLKDLLAAVSANQEKEKIVVSRRKAWEDDDDDLLDL